ncbi:restriction endonuclease [Bacillus litorisediminis]|uniref:restriction endonuclease n=1 Tax=Bacillus litorisediminis TaxID=2922713 RepID=UPI001FAFE951|nr:restriction endonuclease [Bacillus litorisediminis]
MIDWKKVNPTHFEKFIFYTLSRLGFTNREWFGRGGGDKGRDVVAYTFEELPFNLGYERKWIFQCKRWSRLPDKTTIFNEILNAQQHSPDFWVLVIPVNLTADQIDFFNFLDKNNPFKVIVITLVAIEEIIYTFPETKNILLNGTLNEGGINNVPTQI